MRTKVAILGSSGSIGTQALAVCAKHPDLLEVDAINVHSSAEALCEQAWRFKPKYAGIVDAEAAKRVGDLPAGTKLLVGEEAQAELIRGSADVVLDAVMGGAGLKYVLEAIDAGKRIALANKEALVMGGDFVKRALKERGVDMLPVDSEHSAIFQCLRGQERSSLKKILLTASGGPFLRRSKNELEAVTVEEALKHPRWTMGSKITVDCATLMNKGLEVIEAHYLFDASPDTIEVLIHPQSIVHSAVELADGAVLAQLGVPDMALPIQYALLYPHRMDSGFERLDLIKAGRLDFEAPDMERFPCLALARAALKSGGAACAVLSAANEIAVDAFIKKRIGFMDIARVVESALDEFGSRSTGSLDELRALDLEVRARSTKLTQKAGNWIG